MPQFDTSTFSSQLFWLILCFAVLYFYSSKIALPKMKQLLDDRWFHTQGTLQMAHNMKEEAEKIHQSYEEDLLKARKKAHEEISNISKEIASQSSHRKAEIGHLMKERQRVEEKRIKNKKLSLIDELHPTSEALAQAILSKILLKDTAMKKAPKNVP
jgi:F-type H+-transporting ATPase subunit b